jgi:hypothetical protein
MRLEGREWRTLVSTARMGADSYRVVRAERPPAHASLYEDLFGAQLSVDRAAAVDLAIAWWLAARSPRSLIYLPLRSSPADCGTSPASRRLDLVLLHHSLGFRVSQWKQVRARMAEPKVHKVTMPKDALPAFDARDHERRMDREFRDHLHWKTAADTLFIIGSRAAFELEGQWVRELAEESSALFAANPDVHHCAEIGLGRWNLSGAKRRGGYAQLHVECCNRHW